MHKQFGNCLMVVLCAGAIRAAEPGGQTVRETWDAAYLQGAKAGYVHTTIRAAERDGRKIIHATADLNLTVKRFKDTLRLRMETGTEETPDGKVLGVSMRQFVGGERQLFMRGTVEGEQLHVQVDEGRRLDKRIPWNEQVIGLCRLEQLFRDRQVGPGSRFSYPAFEPTYTTVVTNRVTVKDYEDVAVPGSRVKQRLLRVEVVADKIGGVQVPPATFWLDANLTPARSRTELPGIGTLTLQRTTREDALQTGSGVAPTTNIGLNPLIATGRIARPYDTASAVYRVAVRDDQDPATTFARDSRQEVRNVRGGTFELHVHARRNPDPSIPLRAVGPEFLKSGYFINSADARVREYARQAVGIETDPWRKAKLIERWVHDHMHPRNVTEAFAPADRVARTLEGDCTEYAMLTAATCRATGVPSRVAIGLLYVEGTRGPVFGYHAWVEVWVQGQWMPIDATLGRGYVGATHLKISDHSWADTQSLTPLLPAQRVVGKVAIDVVRVGER